ncbi:hypothetical protein AWC11_14765 [Mycobacterium interjectum]|nr:hypothetical protein AWC11_14765 [Mycobacterium interjectum]
MSVQDDKEAGQEEDRQEKDRQEDDRQDEDGQATEKPEPNEEHKEQAAEMMKAYKDLPTVVLPGSGGMVSGTAVNDWLDEDGNPQYNEPEREGSDNDSGEDSGEGSGEQAKADDGGDDESRKEQIEKDKALNEELRKAAAAENKGEKD